MHFLVKKFKDLNTQTLFWIPFIILSKKNPMYLHSVETYYWKSYFRVLTGKLYSFKHENVLLINDLAWLGLSFHTNGNAISTNFFIVTFILFAETKQENGYVSNYGPHCLSKFMQTSGELIQSKL